MTNSTVGQPVRLTVVTASFNALEGLRKTVQSVQEQSMDGIEHVIADGASTDGTREYLESLGPSVRWVSEADDGIGDAMNKGIAMAAGEWILILQADDTFIRPEIMEELWPEFGVKDDIVACEVLLTRDDGPSTLRRTRPLGLLSEFKMTSPHQGMFCRRALYERIGGFDSSYRIAMDFEWLLRAKRQGARLHAVHRVVALMPEGGVSTQTDWPSMRKRLLEDRRLSRQHVRGPLDAMWKEAVWFAYLAFKRVRCLAETRT